MVVRSSVLSALIRAFRVVLKQLLKGSPEIGGGGVIVGHQIEKLRGDACVNPLDDGEIIFHPARISGLWRVGGINVVA